MATNTDKKASNAASLAGKRETAIDGRAIYFYQNDHLATEFTDKGTRHIMSSQDIAIAQLEPAKAAQLLQIDQANSVLGMAPTTMTYSPYGHLEAGDSRALLAFNGQRLDLLIKGYALGNGNRMYHPALFRFSSPDTFSPFNQGGLNPYAYCEGDPINKMDSSGNIPHLIRSFFKGIGNRLNLRTPKYKQSPTVSQSAEPQNETSIQNRPLPEPPAGARLSEQNSPSRPVVPRYRSPQDAQTAKELKKLIKKDKQHLGGLQQENARLRSAISEQEGRGNKPKHERAMLETKNAEIEVIKVKINALNYELEALRSET